MLDEIDIKPALCYASNQIVAFSIDQPDKPVRSKLPILMVSIVGTPAFVVRLLPLYSLKAQFLLELISIIVNLVHCATVHVFLIMNDNLKTNQSFFDLMHQKYGIITDFFLTTQFKSLILSNFFSFMTQEVYLKT